METYLGGLNRMLLQLEVVSLQDNQSAVLVFVTGCAIVGMIAVFLDLAFYTLRGKSLLKLQQRMPNLCRFTSRCTLIESSVQYL